MNLNYNNIKDVVLKKGYKFFTGELNLNMIGIRTMNRKSNNFDDYFCLLYQENGIDKIWINKEFTTDPGIYYLQKELLSSQGCAILYPEQHNSLWTIGMHRGKYQAFVQINPCKIYRDRNKDNYIDADEKSVDKGLYGINQHHGYDSINVGPHSAGCQVHRHPKDLIYVLDIAKKSAAKYGSKFTYTLLTENDFK